jgi:hypothetical protein
MKYALVLYNDVGVRALTPDEERRRIKRPNRRDPGTADRDWLALPPRRRDGNHRSAGPGKTLLTDGPLFRDHWGRVLASLVGYLGDIELAEETAQEAFAAAAELWPN